MVLLLLTGLLSVSAQEEIDLNDRRLLKGLKKFDIPAYSSMQQLAYSKPGLKHDINVGYFFDVGPDHERQIRYVYVGRVESCKRGVCMIGSGEGEDRLAEYFDYFILFDKNNEVRYVEVYNYKASHGYEITARGWLKQFRGYNGKSELRVGKEIDGITGATVSVNAITKDLYEKVQSLNLH